MNSYALCDVYHIFSMRWRRSRNFILFVLGPVKAACFRSCQGLKLYCISSPTKKLVFKQAMLTRRSMLLQEGERSLLEQSGHGGYVPPSVWALKTRAMMWAMWCGIFSMKTHMFKSSSKNFMLVQVQFGNLLHFFRPKKQTQRLCMELLECVEWVQIGIKGKVQKIRSGNQLQDSSIMFTGAEMVAGRKSIRTCVFWCQPIWLWNFHYGFTCLQKKVHVTRSFTTRAVFRIAHGHLSRRNNGNKRPGVQVFQVMLCTTWWDAFVRPWISDPNETMMSCLAWKGCEANNWQQYVKNLACRNFVTLHNKLQSRTYIWNHISCMT